jgi:hypothetical protein
LRAGLPADCSTAARLVCHRHGFASGRELDLESGEVCRGDALVAGHGLHAGHCKPKIWITQAACW